MSYDPQSPSDRADLEPDDDFDQGDCWNCGGEGFVFDCFDGFCLDADIGCDDCTRLCDVCSPPPPRRSQP